MVFSSTQVQSTQPECRYCLESDVPKNLVAPCICKGSFQYVHTACLMKWYDASPEKGLQCSACNTYLARKYIYTEEINPLHITCMENIIQNPFSIIIIIHAFYILLLILFSGYSICPYRLYNFLQCIFHGIQFGKMSILVYKIHNQPHYWSLWLQTRRILLPIVHIFILSHLQQTFFIGGVSADICMCMYFYGHITIVQIINAKRTFLFTNRLDS